MNTTLKQVIKKFKIDIKNESPIEIRNINRTIMAKALDNLSFKVGAEIGVAQGNHAKVLCEENPGLKLYCIDIWERYPGYNEYASKIRKYYKEAREKLTPFNCILVKKFSIEATEDFADKSLDFVYIDGAHDFKNVTKDLHAWSRKVRIGGIVFGHDYQSWRSNKRIVEVKDAVQNFVRVGLINPLFILANDIKDPNFRSDAPGWMFVRQKTDRL